MISITVVGSGSSGNSTILKDSATGKELIVDAGVSPPPLFRFEDVVGVLITHRHNDHIHCIREVMCKPIYGTKEELVNDRVNKALRGDYSKVTYVTPLSTYEVGPFRVTPYHAEHDTPNPVHYKIETADDSLWYGCDAYSYDEDAFAAATSCKKIMVECNYDEGLMESDDQTYPQSVKDRIVNSGHASNQYIYSKFKGLQRNLILCHISENYNSEECIRKVFGSGVRVIDTEECPGALKDVSKRL